MGKKTKSKTRERIWDLKIFKQKTITKENYEENKEEIKEVMENLLVIVGEPALFNYGAHCEDFKQFLNLSTRILRHLNADEKKQIIKINNFTKEKCKSVWSAKPVVVVDDDFK